MNWFLTGLYTSLCGVNSLAYIIDGHLLNLIAAIACGCALLIELVVPS